MFGIRDLIAAQAIDIALPDICLADVVTALRHIDVLAMAVGVQVNPQIWGTAVGQYASLHMIASTPVTHYALYVSQPLFEYDTSLHPFRTVLVKNPLEYQQGGLTLPQEPGLGLTIDRDFLRENALT